MQDKFTRQAANALKLAKTTAQSCNHSYIGTEHILVGLLKEKEGTAGRILEEFNVEEDALRQLIDGLCCDQASLYNGSQYPETVCGSSDRDGN